MITITIIIIINYDLTVGKSKFLHIKQSTSIFKYYI